LLVLDEPTSALDVVTASRLLADIGRLRREQGLAVLLVSHDLAAVRRLADRVVVLDHGQVTATGTVARYCPPFTRAKAADRQRLTRPPAKLLPAVSRPATRPARTACGAVTAPHCCSCTPSTWPGPPRPGGC
jgi:ABC-type glutathione transport system ATPase component